EMQHNFQKTGTHKIRLYPLDPGVTIDQLMVDFQMEKAHSGSSGSNYNSPYSLPVPLNVPGTSNALAPIK
ncbi:MAG TPA: hypothetical protein VL053_19310, partial [Arachidicoccus sp.]|nr:hypothetical protein [Arachidicoccus sp.]